MYAKNSKKVKVETLLLPSYLAFAEGSVGGQMFRKFYAKVNGKKLEVLRDGNYSCAIHITSILKIFSLIKDVQLTVHRAMDAMERAGWYEIKKPKVGAIVVWAAKPAAADRGREYDKAYTPTVRHMGFLISKTKAVHNSDTEKAPVIDDLHYRPIEKFYWHERLGK